VKTILIIDDEKSIRDSLSGILSDEGYKPYEAGSAEAGLVKVKELCPELILLDIWLPGMDGLQALRHIKEQNPDQLVLMMSGHGSIETAVKATKLGAFDFIEKPLSLDKVLLSIQNALSLGQLVEENKRLKAKVAKEYEMIGQSESILDLKQQIAIAAPTSGWVLITGENGTGKELVARAIHLQSRRSAKPFIEVNCAAIPEELIESELFGHEKGAFTGATAKRKGKFDLAHEGTLFLDEIGDMSLKTQAKVLRILQERKFERVGGQETIEVDVRVIAATNKDLQEEIDKGNFREDLYYRLNVLPFHVSPLRERLEDIPLLANHFLDFFCRKESRDVKSLTPKAQDVLKNYNWPGNIRELKNLIERLVIMTQSTKIEFEHLPASLRKENNQSLQPTMIDTEQNLKDAKENFEKEYIRQMLEKHDGNISKTAEAIGLERSNLHRKIKTFDIEIRKN